MKRAALCLELSRPFTLVAPALGFASGAATAFGAAAVALGLVPLAWLWPMVIGATAGSLLESWLGATLEAPGILNNDMLNFINTAAAAVTSLALAAWRS